jgi:hypothetical protein
MDPETVALLECVPTPRLVCWAPDPVLAVLQLLERLALSRGYQHPRSFRGSVSLLLLGSELVVLGSLVARVRGPWTYLKLVAQEFDLRL